MKQGAHWLARLTAVSQRKVESVCDFQGQQAALSEAEGQRTQAVNTKTVYADFK